MAEARGEAITWEQVYMAWSQVVCDLHSEYGIDLTRDVLMTRSWPWLRTRILGLLHADTRTYRALKPEGR